MSNIDDVKNLYEGIAAEAYKMPDRVDPADIRRAQRAKKVRNLATDGATEGERAAAERKTITELSGCTEQACAAAPK